MPAGYGRAKSVCHSVEDAYCVGFNISKKPCCGWVRYIIIPQIDPKAESRLMRNVLAA